MSAVVVRSTSLPHQHCNMCLNQCRPTLASAASHASATTEGFTCLSPLISTLAGAQILVCLLTCLKACAWILQVRRRPACTKHNKKLNCEVNGLSAGAGKVENQEVWIDQREEVGVSGEVDTPVEEGTLGGSRRQAAERKLKPKPVGSSMAEGGANSGGAAAANQKAAGKFKTSAYQAGAAAAKGADSSAGGAQGATVRDPDEDDDVALPAFKKPSSHAMPLLGSVSHQPAILFCNVWTAPNNLQWFRITVA
jgi:hypothetical protein